MSYLRKDGKQYLVVAPECIGRDCLALGSYQHRPVSGGGSRNTGSPDTLCCLTPSPRFHFQLGMSLRNDWSLWEKDMPLVKWFNERGITHADDMSAIILTSIWRRVRGVDLDLEGQIKSYQDYWIRNLDKPAP